MERKKKVLEYVLKVTSDTLDIIRDNEDPLLQQLNNFITNNLGINVNVINQRKYQILDNIQILFEERTQNITDNNLDKLELKMEGLDRNNDNNIKIISDFIIDNYNIQDDSFLEPYNDSHDIIDKIISS